MKRFSLFLLSACGIAFLVSCNKEYNCDCKSISQKQRAVVKITASTKGKADKECKRIDKYNNDMDSCLLK